LEARVQQRTAELASTVGALETEIVERQRAEAQRQRLHLQLVEASRQAGMAELANGVLHNVGNVLNSVNVAANVIIDILRQSRVEGLPRVVGLVREHEQDLAEFLTVSGRGRRLPDYLDQLAKHLIAERESLLAETLDLSTCIQHMKEIVHRQQAYASVSGATVAVTFGEIVAEVLRMQESAIERHGVEVALRIECDERVEIDRSRVIQILVNLVKNATQAVADREVGTGRIEISVVSQDGACARVEVVDNGVGIPAADLTRIFGHGFTTKVDGHGFGLHHSANAATEMGGRLWAESGGFGLGSKFVLELPLWTPAEVG
ncbi:MAG: ATP-binding protein, partial [Planctomycetes bacterium]|nr:ATP-binding protein [Planctomycetota bacterium]